VVVQVGSDAHRHWIGKEVMINSAFYWGPDRLKPSYEFRILGMLPLPGTSPRSERGHRFHEDSKTGCVCSAGDAPGTLADYIAVPIKQLYAKPAHLSLIEAAAIPLAGLTAYR